MKVLPVPATLDHGSVDPFFEAVQAVDGRHVLLDLHRLRWVDPTGMLALLAAGRVLVDRTGHKPRMTLPENGEVLGYLGRMGFFPEALRFFEHDGPLPRRSGGRASDVLLEITPVEENRHVHDVVDKVQRRAGTILSQTLHYPPSAVVQFSVILSEVCQNIIEHAEAPGWVAAQTYNWARRLGRDVLVIAVVDVGRGFRGSLASGHAGRFGDRWGDATALEAAFIHGLTRFPDSGRGQGIQQIRRQVRRWDGILSVRSGSARIAEVPDWDDAPPLDTGLPDFPGAQIHIVLPAVDDNG